MISPAHRTCGFSLIELMGAMAIGSIVILTAVSMLGTAGDRYTRIGGTVATEREARALITRLTADLASARFHRQSLFEKSSSTWPADRLGFFCLQPPAAQSCAGYIGDLCAVHYYLKDLPIGGQSVRCLMRGFRESKPTFMALADHNVPSLFTQQCLTDEPVAFGVISFMARPKSLDTSGRWIDWSNVNDGGPQALDVCLVLARRGLAAKLRLPEEWNGMGSAAFLLGEPSGMLRNRNLEVFSTLIRFGNDENPSITTR